MNLEFKNDKVLVSGFSGKISSEIEVPGDKSISHRAIMLGSIAEGRSVASNISISGDNMSTVTAFRKLGVKIKGRNLNDGKKEFEIKGTGFNGLKEPDSVINTHNSGTLTRLLAGMLAGSSFFSVLSGDKYLNSRPMKRIIEPLGLMGAEIYGRRGNLPPLAINGKKLRGIYYELPVPSAQVKSSIILAGLFAEGNTIVYEKKATRDHTENLLRLQGCPIEVQHAGNGCLITLSGQKEICLKPFNLKVPGDFSSAAFFIALGLLREGSEITVRNVLLNEKRTGLLKVLALMGASLEILDAESEPEKTGDIKASYSALRGVRVPPELVPDMIDEFPIFAVIASFAEGRTVVSGAEELRVKESDRIKTICFNLKKLGSDIKELEDGFEINGNPNLADHIFLNEKKSGRETFPVLNSFGDHRIAMSMIIMGILLKKVKIEVNGTNSISTSFPGFFNVLANAAGFKI